MQKVNVLGTEYIIVEQNSDENKKLDSSLGLCEQYSKKIVIDTMDFEKTDVMAVENIEELRKKVLRHEIIHAFLGESGLRECSKWAEDEEMVDWMSIQLPKIIKAINEVDAL